MTTFSSLMRARRAARGLTFSQLSKSIGYHASYLSLVERGMRQLDEGGVVRLAQALDIDPTEALLASLRERLPEELRRHVPVAPPKTNWDAQHDTTRELQAGHFDFEVEELRFSANIDWSGNLQSVRSFDGCRPNAAGRPIWQMVFRNPVKPRFNITRAPAGLEYEHTSTHAGGRHHEVLFFEQGWRRTPHRATDTFDLAFETYHPKTYNLDATTTLAAQPPPVPGTLQQPLRGSFAVHLVHFVRRLELSVEFPHDYQPARWEAWAWWGAMPLPQVSRNLATAGASRSLTLKTRRGSARLVAEEPLAGYTFAVVWAPADRQSYLEARNGFPTEQPH